MIGLVIRDSNIEGLVADNTLIKGFSQLLPVGLAGLSVVIIYSSVSSSADTYMFTTASSVTQDVLERTGMTQKENLRKSMRYSLVALMALGICMALILRDIVDTTFFFVAMTMSLGFVTLVIWIYPKVNRHSVNFSVLACFLGVILTYILVKDITEFLLVIFAWSSCIAGLLIGFVVNFFVPGKDPAWK